MALRRWWGSEGWGGVGSSSRGGGAGGEGCWRG